MRGQFKGDIVRGLVLGWVEWGLGVGWYLF